MVRTVFLFTVMLSVFLFQGCATKPEAVQQPKIVFPSYPDEPKIAYVDTYRGESQSENDASALDLFLGEDKGRKTISPVIVKPYGVGLQDGKLYVADTGTDTVFIIDEKSKEVSYIGNNPVGRLVAPVAIAFDSNGTVYVSDARQKRVQGYNKVDGKLKFVLGSRLDFVHPTGIAIDKNLNRLYVVDTKGHCFKAFDIATKKLLFTIGERGRGDAQFNFPTNVAVDQRNGNIVIVDTQNFRVQIFDKEGKFIRRFGKIGDRPGMFARPKGVGIDTEGHIYVSDAAFNNVQVFNETGELLLYFGAAGYTPATFRLIAGIFIDETDKIAIADGFSGRVQTFQYLSEKWKAAHPDEYNELKEFKPEI